jgi:hypothetical protein
VLNKYSRRLGMEFEPKAKRDARRRAVPCYRCDGVIRFEWYETSVWSLRDLASSEIPIIRRDSGRRG